MKKRIRRKLDVFRRAATPAAILFGLTFSGTAAAATATVHNNGLIEVIGTDGRDYIRVARVGRELQVLDGQGSPTPIARSPIDAVKKIRFYGNAGNDRFTFMNISQHGQPEFHAQNGYQPDHPQLELFGGTGDDQLDGGSNHDLIVGGEGRDDIKGFHGDDTIMADSGPDELWGHQGRDFLCGGPGADLVVSNENSDWMFMGPIERGVTDDPGSLSPGDYLAYEACSYARQEIRGDFDGDGVIDIAYYLPERALFVSPVAPVPVLPFGVPGDLPIVGDWKGEGIDRVGVYRNGQHFLDVGLPGWTGQEPEEWPGIQFGGLPGDIPVVGDWNSDGISDVGVFRPSNSSWYLDDGPRGWGPDTLQELYGVPFDYWWKPPATFAPSWLIAN